MRSRSGVSFALLRVCFSYYHGMGRGRRGWAASSDWHDAISRIKYHRDINTLALMVSFIYFFRGKTLVNVFRNCLLNNLQFISHKNVSL